MLSTIKANMILKWHDEKQMSSMVGQQHISPYGLYFFPPFFRIHVVKKRIIRACSCESGLPEAYLSGMNYFCVHMAVFIPPNNPRSSVERHYVNMASYKYFCCI